MPEKEVTSFLTIPCRFKNFLARFGLCSLLQENTNWLEANNVSYVAKDMNPPNVPELRPIERYWFVLKWKLRNDGCISKSDADFSRILRKVSGQIERQLLQNLMNSIKRKLRSFSRLTLKK